MVAFFRALNPLSKQSGTNYTVNSLLPSYNEIPDVLAHEAIKIQWEKQLCWYETIDATHLCLLGDHYDHYLLGPKKSYLEKIISAVMRPQIILVLIGEEIYRANTRKECAKGILDFLIFPLLARKLIADTRLAHRKKTYIINTLAWIVAVPLEVLRHSFALALTIALTPLVLFIHVIRMLFNCISDKCNNDQKIPCTMGIL